MMCTGAKWRAMILFLYSLSVLPHETDQKSMKPWRSTKRPMRIASRLTSHIPTGNGRPHESFLEFFNMYTYDLPDLNRPQDCADCPHIYIPVCSNMNITFTNECYMYCANITAWDHKLEKKRMGLCHPFELPDSDEY